MLLSEPILGHARWRHFFDEKIFGYVFDWQQNDRVRTPNRRTKPGIVRIKSHWMTLKIGNGSFAALIMNVYIQNLVMQFETILNINRCFS